VRGPEEVSPVCHAVPFADTCAWRCPPNPFPRLERLQVVADTAADEASCAERGAQSCCGLPTGMAESCMENANLEAYM